MMQFAAPRIDPFKKDHQPTFSANCSFTGVKKNQPLVLESSLHLVLSRMGVLKRLLLLLLLLLLSRHSRQEVPLCV